MKVSSVLISSFAAVNGLQGRLPFNPDPEPDSFCRTGCMDKSQVTDEICGTFAFCNLMDSTGEERENVKAKIPRWAVVYDNSSACFDDHDPELQDGVAANDIPIPFIAQGFDEQNCFLPNITAESCGTKLFCAAFDRNPRDLELIARWDFQNSEQCLAKAEPAPPGQLDESASDQPDGTALQPESDRSIDNNLESVPGQRIREDTASETVVVERPGDTVVFDRPGETVVVDRPGDTVLVPGPRETIIKQGPTETIREGDFSRPLITEEPLRDAKGRSGLPTLGVQEGARDPAKPAESASPTRPFESAKSTTSTGPASPAKSTQSTASTTSPSTASSTKLSRLTASTKSSSTASPTKSTPSATSTKSADPIKPINPAKSSQPLPVVKSPTTPGQPAKEDKPSQTGPGIKSPGQPAQNVDGDKSSNPGPGVNNPAKPDTKDKDKFNKDKKDNQNRQNDDKNDKLNEINLDKPNKERKNNPRKDVNGKLKEPSPEQVKKPQQIAQPNQSSGDTSSSDGADNSQSSRLDDQRTNGSPKPVKPEGPQKNKAGLDKPKSLDSKTSEPQRPGTQPNSIDAGGKAGGGPQQPRKPQGQSGKSGRDANELEGGNGNFLSKQPRIDSTAGSEGATRPKAASHVGRGSEQGAAARGTD
ncbi:hypothetical protein XA68_18508 [Ophiocordyceps unilateralis]|uniref:Uncharacterized protein n=1 Tax=Ophiocordyceps unilateralis TaxID=268505 RepID=A0A2A9P322_OPHUN|nr:hypothetical protein XA68_18508 [Ophiocordyceps unilateralis]